MLLGPGGRGFLALSSAPRTHTRKFTHHRQCKSHRQRSFLPHLFLSPFTCPHHNIKDSSLPHSPHTPLPFHTPLGPPCRPRAACALSRCVPDCVVRAVVQAHTHRASSLPQRLGPGRTHAGCLCAAGSRASWRLLFSHPARRALAPAPCLRCTARNTTRPSGEGPGRGACRAACRQLGRLGVPPLLFPDSHNKHASSTLSSPSPPPHPPTAQAARPVLGAKATKPRRGRGMVSSCLFGGWARQEPAQNKRKL